MNLAKSTSLDNSNVIPIFIRTHKETIENCTLQDELRMSQGTNVTSCKPVQKNPAACKNEEALFRENLPLVKCIACSLCRQLPARLQIEDLEQVGILGPLKAINSFDESQGASLTTYASLRIQGAIVDEIRRNVWVSRSVLQKTQKD
ncbi:MAG: DNA-directed RNA polymerase specialized sigma subunit [Parasphingorhabdus sp.]|jgi:DNA-directed RNA polymerase specialized sigma subunit